MINKKFKIKQKIGEGRSTVFLCEDVGYPGKELALKVLPPNVSSEEANLFREEYFILTKLNHSGIIKARETGVVVTTDSSIYEIKTGSLYIAMEYFPGGSLEKFIVKNEDELTTIVVQIASVLYYLHQSNYIYYDLKPENILISTSDGKPVIKLIDLGLARHTYETTGLYARGTKEYIAPELLSSNDHDHRVDLYSLGMLIYRLIYNKLPFRSSDEMEIYKSHIEADFDYPPSCYSEQLMNVVKKLLAKDPSDRYFTILEVLHELKVPVENIKKDWVPARTFTGRKDALAVINTYINRQSDGEVLSIRGTEGAGKTSLLEEIYYRYNRVIYLYKSGNEPLWKVLLRQLIYSDFLYHQLDEEVISSAGGILEFGSADLIESLKTILHTISKENQFIILLDEYNHLDEFNLEIFRQLIPVFQVNNIKLILTEDSAYPYLTSPVNNLIVVNLSTFTESNLIEFIDKSFALFFPKQDTKKLVMLYADLLPGSINSFIRDLVLLDILEFNENIPAISFDREKLVLLSSSQEVIYAHQVRLLSEEELYFAEMLSLFEIPVGENIFMQIFAIGADDYSYLVKSLREKNIISFSGINSNIEFSSVGIKKYIYSLIPDKNQYHFRLAEILENKILNFNKVEISRHYELAGVFNRALKLLKAEAGSAEKMSAFSYKKKILGHILELPLNKRDENNARYELCKTLFRIGEKKASLDFINDLLLQIQPRKKQEELVILQGKCLISTGNPAEGIKVLNNLLHGIKKENVRHDVLAEIAAAEFDLSNYNKVEDICSVIVNENKPGFENRGKAYNLLGLVQIYKENNIDSAINHFMSALECYEKAGLPANVLGIEINLGNIYFLKREHSAAETHWARAAAINAKIGNLAQDARLLLNYGNYYFDREDFEKAIENYKRANSIFASLGDKNLEGMVLINLGETYMSVCNYQDSYDTLKSAKKIFAGLKNYEEESEAVFMLARFFYLLGGTSGLAEMISEYKALSEQNFNDEKHAKNLELLEQMELISIEQHSQPVTQLKELKNYYYESESRGLYSSVVFLLAESLLQSSLFEECKAELEDKKIVAISEQYKLVDAERLYYLGRLADKAKLEGLKPSKEYFEEAYSLIEEQSITAITLKILFSIMKIYSSRGILNKAQEIVVYVKAIVEFIAESIRDNNLRQAFFSKPERKIMLDYISKLNQAIE